MILDRGKYFLYRHIRHDKNEPFYIGVGTKRTINHRALSTYERAYSSLRNNVWKKIVRKTQYSVEILIESNDYLFIHQKEIEFIKLYGRIDLGTGILANLTDGGQGVVGKTYTDEFRKRISIQSMGRPAWNKGISPSNETRKMISYSLKGNKLSIDTIEKREATRKKKALERGYARLDKHKQNIGNANSKKVYMYDENQQLIDFFGSCHDAEKKLGFSFQMVSYACLRYPKAYKGMYLSYDDFSKAKNNHSIKTINTV